MKKVWICNGNEDNEWFSSVYFLKNECDNEVTIVDLKVCDTSDLERVSNVKGIAIENADYGNLNELLYFIKRKITKLDTQIIVDIRDVSLLLQLVRGLLPDVEVDFRTMPQIWSETRAEKELAALAEDSWDL